MTRQQGLRRRCERPVDLFGAEYSVYVRICRIVLAEKGVEYTLHPIDVFASDGPPQDYLDLNPFGRIPSLRHGNLVLYETDAITAYIDEAFDGPDLMPAGIQARARARQIMRLADTEIYKHLVWGVCVPWRENAEQCPVLSVPASFWANCSDLQGKTGWPATR